MNFKVILRSILKQKRSAAIILSGIIIGMTSVIFIWLWLAYQVNFDRFNENYDTIYRVIISKSGADNMEGLAEMHADILSLVRDNIPEAEHSARFKPFPRSVVKMEDQVFYETGIAAVDSSFLQIFTLKITASNGKPPLHDPYEIYVSERIAEKYFGELSPIDRVLEIDSIEVRIGGVFEGWPVNTHLQFDILIPHDLLSRYGITHPWNNYLYITIGGSHDIRAVEQKISNLAQENNEVISYYQMELGLQPLKDIHFTTSLGSEMAKTEKKTKIYFFGIIAVMIIVFSVINFTTLVFANQLTDLQNLAIKKTLGSRKLQLLLELIVKSLFYIIIAFLVAGTIVELLKSQFVHFTNVDLRGIHLGIKGIAAFLGIFAAAVVIGGLYPNLLLAGLSPSFIFRIDSKFRTMNISLRNIFVIIQFAVSIILVVCTLVNLRQLNYMLNYELGFNPGNIMYFPAREPFVQRFEALKQDFTKNSFIEGVSIQSRSFFTGGKDYAFWEGKQEDENVIVDIFGVDHDFFTLLGVEVIAGRDFSEEISTDKSEAFIINQEAARQMRLEDPVGKRFYAFQHWGQVTGMIGNIHFNSLKHAIDPQVFFIYGPALLPWIYTGGNILVKYQEGREEEVISFVESYWKDRNPDQPFEYDFLDKSLRLLYENEKRNLQLFGIFSVVAILISCLGLHAIVAFTTEERTKEIGIRKSFGASYSDIVTLFFRNLFICLLISFLISAPVAYYIMDKWLQNFANRPDLSVWTFIVSFLLAAFVSSFTMLADIRKSAKRNPAESLRYE
ncbi:MAG: ABC transporter permease [Bacteroidales bacterium]|nr:MAG: ABC transporter permease [Bacteroidales bacterium]